MISDRTGEQITPLERTIELADMIAYAGATWDWHRLHYDRDFLASNGLPAPVVDGQVFGALLVAALQDYFGPDAAVRRLSFRFKNLVFAGETVRVHGEVTGVSVTGTATEVALTLGVDVMGADARPATSATSATVLLP